MELEICFSAASPRGSGCDLAFYDLRQAPRRMLKAVRYKYAYSLYDVEADPYETAELNATNNAELAEQLRRMAALNVREPYCPELAQECVAPTPLPTTPLQPSAAPPSAEPSQRPTRAPSKRPTRAPTAPPEPTPLPSAAPSPAPSRAPSDAPSTPRPSHAPTDKPSARPSPAPTARPTRPTATPRPTTTLQPTSGASTLPTSAPTGADDSNKTSGGGAASGAPGTAPPDQASVGLLAAMVSLAVCALALAALAFFIAWPVWKRRRAQQRRDTTKLASPHPPIDVPEAFEREQPQLPARTPIVA
jgi:hypothetical protein